MDYIMATATCCEFGHCITWFCSEN